MPELVTPGPVPPETKPAPAPETGVPAQNIRFFSTDNGTFQTDTNTYLFKLSEEVEDYHVIGTVRYGDHLDPDQSSGRTLYTVGGRHRHLLRLGSDGVLRLGNNIDLDAEGLTGLAELHFTVAVLYLPNAGANGKMSFSKTHVSRVVIFDPLDPDAEYGPPPPNPPFIRVDGTQKIIKETVADGVREHYSNTGLRITVIDSNNDLDQIRIESVQDGRWQADKRFKLIGTNLFIKSGQHFDYEDANNPNGVITLRITATDAAGHSAQRILTLQLTNADDPAAGSVTVTDSVGNALSGPVTTGTMLAYRQTTSISDPDDSSLTLDHQWQRQMNGGGQDIAGQTGRAFTPTAAGTYRLKVTATDSLFSSDTDFHTAPVTVTTLAPPAADARDESVAIYENHPLTKPIIDLEGTGTFAMAPTAGSPDNQFFRVDAATGKIWFVPFDANGNGRVDAGDYPLLDAEDHRDQGGDGTYDLQIIRTAPDGTSEMINLALTVDDLPGIYNLPSGHPYLDIA